MGIPSYFAHFVRQHRRIIKPIKQLNKPINNLYLDCNAFIYDGVNNNKNAIDEPLLMKFVCDKLIYYINLLKPTKKVFIAFDGVAPVAKLNQQRKRRFLTGFQAKFMTEYTGKASNTWNTSAITPGTLFMQKLAGVIKQRFLNPREFGLEAFVISCADEVGEGEHKLFAYIRDNKVYHHDTTTVIYGLDADLIMLTLSHLPISANLYLFRETPEFIKSIDNTLNPNELYLLDIPAFGKSIVQDFTGKELTLPDSESINNERIINDYIFIFFLLGNDFMPHFPALNIRTKGIELLINAYKHCISSKHVYLTDEKHNINWRNLRILVEYLSINEGQYIKAEYLAREKQNGGAQKFLHKKNLSAEKELENTLINLPMTDRAIEQYINPTEVGWEARYYRVLFDIAAQDEERKKEICVNYLEGLEWTYKYYKADCVDWRWTYKYDYPPLFGDLLKYMPYFDKCYFGVNKTTPVTPTVQLSYVLPKQSLYLIPDKVGERLLKAKPEWYVEDCDFQWVFCKYFWEAHVNLPEIDIAELEHHLQGGENHLQGGENHLQGGENHLQGGKP